MEYVHCVTCSYTVEDRVPSLAPFLNQKLQINTGNSKISFTLFNHEIYVTK